MDRMNEEEVKRAILVVQQNLTAFAKQVTYFQRTSVSNKPGPFHSYPTDLYLLTGHRCMCSVHCVRRELVGLRFVLQAIVSAPRIGLSL